MIKYFKSRLIFIIFISIFFVSNKAFAECSFDINTYQEIPINNLTSVNKLTTFEVKQGDILWNIIKNNFSLKSYTKSNKEITIEIDKIKDKIKKLSLVELKKIGFSSGNISLIHVGDKLDLEQYFPKNIANNKNETKDKKDTICFDSDGGVNFYEQGRITVGNWPGVEEGCLNSEYAPNTGRIVEHYCPCEDKSIQAPLEYVCPSGCSNGKCNSENTDCKKHSLNITKIINENGYISVSYNGIGVRDAVEITISRRDEFEKRCVFSYKGTTCVKKKDIYDCTLKTRCKYPEVTNILKITDNACSNVSAEKEIDK